MKILLIGKPKSGKSTLLERLIGPIKKRQGFITKEIIENGQRVGFKLIDAKDDSTTLARVGLKSHYKVSRYGVDIKSLDKFLSPLFDFEDSQLLYVDEVGQMELFSDKFKALVINYLDSANNFIGTIPSVYEDDFIKKIKSYNDLLIIEITPENRDIVLEVLNEVLNGLHAFSQLSNSQQKMILEFSKGYAKNYSYIQLRKLFKNAIPYLLEGRVKQIGNNRYLVGGNNDSHNVSLIEEKWSCDCNLFNGRGQFTGRQGECSHIQAAKLLGA